ncbi:hypothetical protein MRB53_004371 [Persea americana]|uniref:Uncharacterized protein n=1 Tax=Persea americana TaxID=3435 RepID=A0ACC2MAK6_PERAE|nr:hypothetical protein MRB53_004371 [Persea americana]
MPSPVQMFICCIFSTSLSLPKPQLLLPSPNPAGVGNTVVMGSSEDEEIVVIAAAAVTAAAAAYYYLKHRTKELDDDDDDEDADSEPTGRMREKKNDWIFQMYDLDTPPQLEDPLVQLDAEASELASQWIGGEIALQIRDKIRDAMWRDHKMSR